MEKTTKVSTIGLGLSLGLAWATGVLIVGFMALTMEQITVEPFRAVSYTHLTLPTICSV